MKRIKVVIVDDEQLARNRIQKLLKDEQDIHVVQEFESGAAALEFIQHHDVDIVFLDIHMPEISGFDVLSQLDENRRPFIIFATADKESAIKAFEYQALDYLLKPFRSHRFYDSLKIARNYVELKRKAELGDRFVSLVDEFDSKAKRNIKINETTQLDFDDIIFLKSDGNYVRFYTSKTSYELVRSTLQSLEQDLNDGQFLRIHRQIIINTYFLREVNYQGNNEFIFHLDQQIQIKSSRAYRDVVDRFLETQH